jgi:hypothetical protein
MIAAAIPAMASVASAQPKHDKFAKKQEKFERKRAKIERQQARYNERNGYGNGSRDRVYYEDQGYRDEGYYEDSQPNVYDRHRKAMNLGIGAAAGAIVGGLIGGKKGALIGAGIGVAGGAIVTAKQAPRNYPRY